MRAVLAVCLLAACAGVIRPAAGPQRVELPGGSWSIAYRLVLDDPAAPRLEGHVEVTNTTAEDWADATVTLATASPGIDRDADGIRDSADLCPGDREDVDGNNDDDGCPEPDNDADRILDGLDRCPNEPETYNGVDDEDGCPDRGITRIHDEGDSIIEWVYFTPGSDVVKPVSFAVVDEIAATILGNPQLRVIEVTGHTDRTERDPWSLSIRRAAAVTQRLIDQGVPPERLTLGPYAATQPDARGTTVAELARNRRVGFVIVKRDDVAATASTPAIRPGFDPPRPELVDDLRYALAQPVTLPRSQSATLAIVDKPITAQELLLWQPDPDVTGSATHPFRAVRVVNTTGFVLQRGPIEIVVGGRVIKRAVMRRLESGETTWIREDLDPATSVVVRPTVIDEPGRVIGSDRGALVLENVTSQSVSYAIESRSTHRIELHHRRLPDHTVKAAPSGTVELADRLIVSRDVIPGAVTRVEITEEQPHRLDRPLTGIPSGELRIYLDGSKLPAGVGDLLRAALTHVRARETGELALADERSKLNAAARRWQQSKRPLDRATRTELDNIGRAIGQAAELLERERAILDDLAAKLPTW